MQYVTCNSCGASVIQGSTACTNCGAWLHTLPNPTPIYVHHKAPRSQTVAVLLELLPGFFFQTFGIGHIYAGKVVNGLVIMFGYWLLLFANVILTVFLIGIITLPLCWIMTLIISSILAAQTARNNPY